MTATLVLYHKATPLLRSCKAEGLRVRYWFQIGKLFPNGIGPYLNYLGLREIPYIVVDNFTTGTINMNHTSPIELYKPKRNEYWLAYELEPWICH